MGAGGLSALSGAGVAMRIAIIGGLERHGRRSSGALGRRAATWSSSTGARRGRHAGELETMVQRCDLTIIVTQVNSHGAMHLAKRAAARFGRPALIVRTCGPSSFSAILASLEASSEWASHLHPGDLRSGVAARPAAPFRAAVER